MQCCYSLKCRLGSAVGSKPKAQSLHEMRHWIVAFLKVDDGFEQGLLLRKNTLLRPFSCFPTIPSPQLTFKLNFRLSEIKIDPQLQQVLFVWLQR